MECPWLDATCGAEWSAGPSAPAACNARASEAEGAHGVKRPVPRALEAREAGGPEARRPGRPAGRCFVGPVGMCVTDHLPGVLGQHGEHRGSPAERSRSIRSSVWSSGCMATPRVVAHRCIRCQTRPAWMRCNGSNGSRTARVPIAAAVGNWMSLVAWCQVSLVRLWDAGRIFATERITGGWPELSTVIPSFLDWRVLQSPRYQEKSSVVRGSPWPRWTTAPSRAGSTRGSGRGAGRPGSGSPERSRRRCASPCATGPSHRCSASCRRSMRRQRPSNSWAYLANSARMIARLSLSW
ncbi:hypothetical protein EV192_112385 [Actinocrispum wychmicini]|uniref:Uncharacterized protein n=1 Tax=Actinocrispum wychmicini TaxID=1213861 RepID=A0A4R2J2T2_9PSEU|nr:hypothetical protein EV192_112385 [Actinocrispum wychmicini]